jgi:septal ring factor EnvC (AmiA/AmiB activator)
MTTLIDLYANLQHRIKELNAARHEDEAKLNKYEKLSSVWEAVIEADFSNVKTKNPWIYVLDDRSQELKYGRFTTSKNQPKQNIPSNIVDATGKTVSELTQLLNDTRKIRIDKGELKGMLYHAKYSKLPDIDQIRNEVEKIEGQYDEEIGKYSQEQKELINKYDELEAKIANLTKPKKRTPLKKRLAKKRRKSLAKRTLTPQKSST